MAEGTWHSLRPASRTLLGGWSSSLGTEGQPPPEQRPDGWTQGPGGAGLPTQPSGLPGRGGHSRSSPRPWARPFLPDGTSQMGRGLFCHAWQEWTHAGEWERHSKQRGPPRQRPVVGRLICMQGPPLRELPPRADLSRSSVFLLFLSLSRSEREQGQEQRHVPGGEDREGEGWAATRPCPGQGGGGGTEQPPGHSPLWAPKRSCPLAEPGASQPPASAGAQLGSGVILKQASSGARSQTIGTA